MDSEQKCKRHLQEFGVRGYPTLMWFNKDGSVVDYNGGREESDLTSFALDRWQAELPPPEVSCAPHLGLLQLPKDYLP